MEKVRKHLIFHGEVQGVGFRWTARSTASRYGVSGWVKNLYDGTVEAEAEGTPRDISAFLQQLKEARWAHVEYIEEKEIPLLGGYDFEIR